MAPPKHHRQGCRRRPSYVKAGCKKLRPSRIRIIAVVTRRHNRKLKTLRVTRLLGRSESLMRFWRLRFDCPANHVSLRRQPPSIGLAVHGADASVLEQPETL
jgi:hypothetical protein